MIFKAKFLQAQEQHILMCRNSGKGATDLHEQMKNCYYPGRKYTGDGNRVRPLGMKMERFSE